MPFNQHTFVAIKSLPCIYAIKDLNHCYRYMSDTFAHVVGFDNAEAGIGITDYDFKCDGVAGIEEYHKQDKLAWQNKNAKCIHIYTWSDGDKKILLDQKQAIYNENDVCIGNNLYAIDIKESLNSFESIVNLFQIDKCYFNIKQKKNISYHMLDCYPDLTKRESQCLFYLLRGRNVKAIGRIMGISPRTVEHYINIFKVKFCCSTRDQIIQYAQHNNFLNVILNNLLSEVNLTIHL